MIMKLKIGDRVRVRINKIQENGCYCSLGQGYFGFIPNVLMPSFIDEKWHCTNAVNEIVDVVIYDIKNNGFILLSDEIKFMVPALSPEKMKDKGQRKVWLHGKQRHWSI